MIVSHSPGNHAKFIIWIHFILTGTGGTYNKKKHLLIDIFAVAWSKCPFYTKQHFRLCCCISLLMYMCPAGSFDIWMACPFNHFFFDHPVFWFTKGFSGSYLAFAAALQPHSENIMEEAACLFGHLCLRILKVFETCLGQISGDLFNASTIEYLFAGKKRF
ncbi:hypothetical protein ACJX0J_010112, partial [Zea mays]